MKDIVNITLLTLKLNTHDKGSRTLIKKAHIPKVHWYGQEGNNNAIVFDAFDAQMSLFKLLETVFVNTNINYFNEVTKSLNRCLSIWCDISKVTGFTHGDLHANNILCYQSTDKLTMCVIDYGRCVFYQTWNETIPPFILDMIGILQYVYNTIFPHIFDDKSDKYILHNYVHKLLETLFTQLGGHQTFFKYGQPLPDKAHTMYNKCITTNEIRNNVENLIRSISIRLPRDGYKSRYEVSNKENLVKLGIKQGGNETSIQSLTLLYANVDSYSLIGKCDRRNNSSTRTYRQDRLNQTRRTSNKTTGPSKQQTLNGWMTETKTSPVPPKNTRNDTNKARN